MVGFFHKLDALLPARAERILEVGVGEGKVAARLRERYPEATILGLDLPDAQLSNHWKTNDLTGVFASADHIPFPDDSFDLVLGVEMLEHVGRPGAVLQDLARVARGPAILTVPWEPWWRAANMARGSYLKDFGNTPGHINHWTHRGFKNLVAQHFAVRSSTVAFPWTLVQATKH